MAMVQPPFDLERETLVTAGNVDLGMDRLTGALSWLTNCIQDHHRAIGVIAAQLETLAVPAPVLASAPSLASGDALCTSIPIPGPVQRPDTAASSTSVEGSSSTLGVPRAGTPGDGERRRSTVREELLAMQISALRHEVGAAPKAADLERHRTRIAAELSTLSDQLHEGLREANERTQRELATSTSGLQDMLQRISTDLFGRLEVLEARINEAAAGTRPSSRASFGGGAAKVSIAPPAAVTTTPPDASSSTRSVTPKDMNTVPPMAPRNSRPGTGQSHRGNSLSGLDGKRGSTPGSTTDARAPSPGSVFPSETAATASGLTESNLSADFRDLSQRVALLADTVQHEMQARSRLEDLVGQLRGKGPSSSDDAGLGNGHPGSTGQVPKLPASRQDVGAAVDESVDRPVSVQGADVQSKPSGHSSDQHQGKKYVDGARDPSRGGSGAGGSSSGADSTNPGIDGLSIAPQGGVAGEGADALHARVSDLEASFRELEGRLPRLVQEQVAAVAASQPSSRLADTGAAASATDEAPVAAPAIAAAAAAATGVDGGLGAGALGTQAGGATIDSSKVGEVPGRATASVEPAAQGAAGNASEGLLPSSARAPGSHADLAAHSPASAVDAVGQPMNRGLAAHTSVGDGSATFGESSVDAQALQHLDSRLRALEALLRVGGGGDGDSAGASGAGGGERVLVATTTAAAGVQQDPRLGGASPSDAVAAAIARGATLVAECGGAIAAAAGGGSGAGGSWDANALVPPSGGGGTAGGAGGGFGDSSAGGSGDGGGGGGGRGSMHGGGAGRAVAGSVSAHSPELASIQAELDAHRRMLDVVQKSLPKKAAEAMRRTSSAVAAPACGEATLGAPPSATSGAPASATFGASPSAGAPASATIGASPSAGCSGDADGDGFASSPAQGLLTAQGLTGLESGASSSGAFGGGDHAGGGGGGGSARYAHIPELASIKAELDLHRELLDVVQQALPKKAAEAMRRASAADAPAMGEAAFGAPFSEGGSSGSGSGEGVDPSFTQGALTAQGLAIFEAGVKGASSSSGGLGGGSRQLPNRPGDGASGSSGGAGSSGGGASVAGKEVASGSGDGPDGHGSEFGEEDDEFPGPGAVDGWDAGGDVDGLGPSVSEAGSVRRMQVGSSWGRSRGGDSGASEQGVTGLGGLVSAIEALQQGMGLNNERLGELHMRMSQIEAEGMMDRLCIETSPPASADKPKGDLHHLMDANGMGGNAIPFVSKKSLQQAVVGIREDVRNWLEALNASMLDALQQKADCEELKNVTTQVTNAASVAGESLAAFAKRSFNGRCASCDTPINVDLANVRRPISVGGMQDLWSTHGSPGAKFTIRPPDGNRHFTGGSSNGKLPKIQEPRVSKDFPKGKVLRQSAQSSSMARAGSAPDL